MPKNPDLKRHLISALITFLSAFSLTFGLSLTDAITVGGPITTDLLISLSLGAGLTGLRAVFKILNEKFVK